MANSTFSEMSLKCLLVGGFKHDFFDFHVIYGTILPIDFNIFQRGRYTTNQISTHGDLGIHHFKKHKNIKQYSSLSPTFPHCNFPSHRILCFCKSWLHPPIHKNILMRRRRRVLGGISFYIHSPYIDLIHGRYLQIRFLKWPLIFWVFVAGKKDTSKPRGFFGKNLTWRSQTPGNCSVPCDSCHETRSLDTIRSHGKIVGKCPRGSMIFLLKPPCLRGLSIAMFDCYRLCSSLQSPTRFLLNLPNILMGICFSIFSCLRQARRP